MSDRCYTDCHLFQICLASVDYIFPRRTRINTDFCSVYSVSSVDYLFSTEVTDGHGGELTITFNGGCVVSASGRFWERELGECP